tara:strand:- start:677 stop:952 length:276 start_codon:yes stop_codon:yes gene_type:complete
MDFSFGEVAGILGTVGAGTSALFLRSKVKAKVDQIAIAKKEVDEAIAAVEGVWSNIDEIVAEVRSDVAEQLRDMMVEVRQAIKAIRNVLSW